VHRVSIAPTVHGVCGRGRRNSRRVHMEEEDSGNQTRVRRYEE